MGVEMLKTFIDVGRGSQFHGIGWAFFCGVWFFSVRGTAVGCDLIFIRPVRKPIKRLSSWAN